jgi:NADPH:quinone reductase-like Zn-dependent oxidoreductase
VKAIVYTKYGSPDVLQLKEVEKPVPKEDEVLIKIYAASVNSWDWDLLKGKPFLVRIIGGLLKPRHKILGADIAGRIETIGKNVKDFLPGDEVFGDIAGSGFGGFAEYVTVPEKFLAKKSPAMTFELAAALPQAGLLALQGLRYKGTIKQGQTVLINGAGGGVGTLGLQYAKLLGATVTCVDRAEKFDILRSLGADHLIDYTKEDYTRTGIQYDRILDVIAHRSITDYKRALKPGGVFAMIGGSMGGLLLQLMLLSPIISLFSRKKIGLMGYKPNRKDLDNLSQLFEEGKVIPVIDRCYPLQEVAAALQHLGDGHVKGKIIISVNDEGES